jgi:hypothetical protein
MGYKRVVVQNKRSIFTSLANAYNGPAKVVMVKPYQSQSEPPPLVPITNPKNFSQPTTSINLTETKGENLTLEYKMDSMSTRFSNSPQKFNDDDGADDDDDNDKNEKEAIINVDVDILRPWIKQPEYFCTKQNLVAKKMINPACLTALFKCMASTCSYFTYDRRLFQIHMELHIVHQPSDSKNYLLCAYCAFRSDSHDNLITHIVKSHNCEKFSCSKCFFRSLNSFQILSFHYDTYHPEFCENLSLIALNPLAIKKPQEDLMMIKKFLIKTVPALFCICKLFSPLFILFL